MSAQLINRLRMLLPACAALLVCAFATGVPASTPASAARPVASVATDEGTDGICDAWNDVDDPDCWEDSGDDGDYPDSGDDGNGNGNWSPPDISGPTGPPPVIKWPSPPKGAYAHISKNGRTAVAPKSAPKPIKQMIRAANSITRKRYVWGGGHGRWNDKGYDCSGSVSFVLHAAGYLDYPLVSGDLARWGAKGRGNWVRIYANRTHVFMVIAGLRFDTSSYGAGGGSGPRWRGTVRPTRGFKLRHPAGL